MLMIVMLVMTVGAGFTTTTSAVRYPDQACPWVPVDRPDSSGGFSGFPQAQRTRGTPRLSTSTAVPDWRTDWRPVTRSPLNPWFVTRVSARSTTEVRPRR
jgi:hypothetical protein